MSALAVSAIVFACVFGGAVVGMCLRAILPAHHLDDQTKDVVRLATGLVATMAALVLGLLVASAKGAYDAEKDGLDRISANLTLLDATLAEYGPATKQARATLRGTVAAVMAKLWPDDKSQQSTLGPAEATPGGRSFYADILSLAPATETQRTLQAQAVSIASDLGRARLLLIAEQESAPVSGVFLIVLVSWLVMLFASFGLFAPRNATVFAALLISDFSVSGAIFLILELGQPFSGVIQISSAPMRDAFAHLGQ